MEADRDAIPHGDPLALFDAWLAEAELSEPDDANAMAVATSTTGGLPSLIRAPQQSFDSALVEGCLPVKIELTSAAT